MPLTLINDQLGHLIFRLHNHVQQWPNEALNHVYTLIHSSDSLALFSVLNSALL